jgi:hypothetical protein
MKRPENGSNLESDQLQSSVKKKQYQLESQKFDSRQMAAVGSLRGQRAPTELWVWIELIVEI